MKIYTKTGDDGSTGLFGGDRVSKVDPRVVAYGTVDELNACLGLARVSVVPHGAASSTIVAVSSVDVVLAKVQVDLFVLGAELATAPGKESKLRMALISEESIALLERAIDEHEATLPALTSFVLPGGSAAGAALHVARTVCRRAERAVWSIPAPKPRAELLVYLNRLSDLLFVLARSQNQSAGVHDIPWEPAKQS